MSDEFRCARCWRRLAEGNLYKKRIQRSLCLDCAGKGYRLEVIYDGIVTPRRHWVAVTLNGRTGAGGSDHS